MDSQPTTPVSRHFDEEAPRYDYWKKRNWFYFQTLKDLYAKAITPDQSVLEVGCGTGDILAGVIATRRTGLDISPGMIAKAREKYPTMEWFAGTVSDIRDINGTFDIIYLSDVIEHLEDVDGTFRDMKRFTHPGTTVLINMANPLWEPLLMLLEKLHMKMPEGPHHRITTKQLTAILARHGYHLVSRKHQMLFPTYVPILTPLLQLVERLPLINALGLIEILQYDVR